MEHFIQALKQYADFEGRATRTQYWMFYLLFLIFYVVLLVVDAALGTVVLSSIYVLALLVPNFSIAARRLHDTTRSGWWQLLVLIPLIGPIVLLVFCCQDSHDDNEFGPNPKAVSEV